MTASGGAQQAVSVHCTSSVIAVPAVRSTFGKRSGAMWRRAPRLRLVQEMRGR
jgi:hypothetical protein